jgi:hypothetical protein
MCVQMRLRITQIVLGVIVVLALFACGDGTPPPPRSCATAVSLASCMKQALRSDLSTPGQTGPTPTGPPPTGPPLVSQCFVSHSGQVTLTLWTGSGQPSPLRVVTVHILLPFGRTVTEPVNRDVGPFPGVKLTYQVGATGMFGEASCTVQGYTRSWSA